MDINNLIIESKNESKVLNGTNQYLNFSNFLLLTLKNPVICLVGLFFLNLIFKLLFTPLPFQMGPNSLTQQAIYFSVIENILQNNPLLILLPTEFGSSGLRWWTTFILPMYFLYKTFSPMGVYLFVSSLLIITSFMCSWKLFRSHAFSCTLGLLFAIGTQLSYALTFGEVLGFYLVLTFISINLTSTVMILQSKFLKFHIYSIFVITLILSALSMEMWLDYATPLILSLGFIAIWSYHHGKSSVKKSSIILFFITLIITLCYVLIECYLGAIGKYSTPGLEAELVFTHKKNLLILDDLIINFFTYLYMTLTNYLPSFLFFSNSVTYLQVSDILAGQNGYHASSVHLAFISYLLEWRFFAGIIVFSFFTMGWKWLKNSWKNTTNITHLILFLLFIGIIFGFPTHLIIKVRPYNTVPMLTYKCIISVYFLTIMIAYISMIYKKNFKKLKNWYLMLSSIWLTALLSALTRPAAINAGLTAVELHGYSDPINTIYNFFTNYIF